LGEREDFICLDYNTSEIGYRRIFWYPWGE
jgi:hypothetical protein